MNKGNNDRAVLRDLTIPGNFIEVIYDVENECSSICMSNGTSDSYDIMGYLLTNLKSRSLLLKTTISPTLTRYTLKED